MTLLSPIPPRSAGTSKGVTLVLAAPPSRLTTAASRYSGPPEAGARGTGNGAAGHAGNIRAVLIGKLAVASLIRAKSEKRASYSAVSSTHAR